VSHFLSTSSEVMFNKLLFVSMHLFLIRFCSPCVKGPIVENILDRVLLIYSFVLHFLSVILESISVARNYVKCPKYDNTNAYLHSESVVHTALRQVSSSLNLQPFDLTDWRRNWGELQKTQTLAKVKEQSCRNVS
jgi:hypothetical protein